ncbi:hypothetical protein FFF93_016135 [Arthrobacter sp. KBS0702]|uniref:hypothetical protein n=1 Tax=Arthrobacter sp. KBS0702 TaxID=2578107 RepID=UPI00110D32BE|nr:hypothetical protein [Arthrobacter sp. KBS0702]QDW31120.1 hypothetical protein FFF93_016135 [Arthrobacter sp. KBS0702]
MTDHDRELSLYVDGRNALVAGDATAIAELFRKLDVKEEGRSNLGSGVADLLASLAGAVSMGMSANVQGNSFHMTPDSYARFLELAGSTEEKLGVVSGVLRQSDGRIDTIIELVSSSPINPAVVANVQMMAAALAIRVALKELDDLVQAVDAKLDTIVRDIRDEALGNVQGTTHVLDKAFGYFEETGRLNDALWDQVSGQAAELAQAHAVALNHLNTIADGLGVKNLGKRVSNAEAAAKGELKHWLVIAAVALTNMVRMDSLEAVRSANDGSDSAAHSRHIVKSRERRMASTSAAVRDLSDAVSAAVNVDTFTRVANPMEMPRLYTAAEELQRLLRIFSSNFGLAESATIKRTQWHESVLRLGQKATEAVAGAAVAVAEGVASFPKAIGDSVEDTILHVAKGIEARRVPVDPQRPAVEAGHEAVLAPEPTEAATPHH